MCFTSIAESYKGRSLVQSSAPTGDWFQLTPTKDTRSTILTTPTKMLNIDNNEENRRKIFQLEEK